MPRSTTGLLTDEPSRVSMTTCILLTLCGCVSGKTQKPKKRRKQRFQRRAEQQRGAVVEEVEDNIPRKCTYGKGADVWTSSEGGLVNQKRSLMQITCTHTLKH